ncbi:hypothetical protein GIB67_024144 [Kingdonia uniflora]|uniref:Syntaxin 6/10/61 N-terminal domain-containing protein n=1 Tax=Kingdonia uniflora TaxID=39325 RepID=A0A7J7LZC7_9MAGN|nr:hypothetical protein GIB67_024144 [Kingdonia uniflora]
MGGSFRQWESDPLFSAAEVVQDSADRCLGSFSSEISCIGRKYLMESIFRMLLHEKSLVGVPADPKLLSAIDYHKRDLATALGTTKWQLEDFERVVNQSALSDRYQTGEDATSRHKQFIRAIREQIVHTEKDMEEPSTGDSKRNTQWVNFNKQERDGLAVFLSGANPVDHHTQFDQNSTIMRRFLDSTSTSGFDDRSEEIVELKTEEVGGSKVNGIMHTNSSFDSSMENKLRKVGAQYSIRLGFEAPVSVKESTGDKHDGSWDLDASDSNAKNLYSKSKLRGSRSMLNVWGFLGNFWLVHGNNMIKPFTKRRKDGKLREDLDQRQSSLYIDIPQAEQVLIFFSTYILNAVVDI